jgi:tripartite-type tricarboxylate transporter receptor subunit TctC
MAKPTRRTTLAGLTAFVTAGAAAAEAPWPSRPIALVHGFAAGGATDTVARILADGLSRRLGQQIVVEAKPGASGTIAAAQVARAAPDGYTLIVIPGGHATNAALFKKLPYRTVEDFSPISMISEYPFVFVTHPDHEIRTLADLIGVARSRTTPLLYGTPGIGSVHHLAVELFADMAGIRLQQVAYRGSAHTVIDLLGRRIDFMVDPPTQMMEFVREGKLRALAVSGAARFFALPEVPTVSEAGLTGYVVASWQGLAAPAGVPNPIVNRLNREIAELLTEPEIAEHLKILGNSPAACSPEEFKARIANDVEKWTALVAAAHIERK